MSREFTRHTDSDILYASHINDLQVALEDDDLRIDGKADLGHQHEITDVTGLVPALADKTDLGHTHEVADITDFVEGVQQQVALIPNGNGELGDNTNFPNTTYDPTPLASGDVGHFVLAAGQTCTTPWISIGKAKSLILYYTGLGASGSTIQVHYRRQDGAAANLGTTAISSVGSTARRVLDPSVVVMTHLRFIISNNHATEELHFGGFGLSPWTSAGDSGAYTKSETYSKAEVYSKSEVDSGISAHTSLTNNPHGVTKAQVGLGNVDNVSNNEVMAQIRKYRTFMESASISVNAETTGTSYNMLPTAAVNLTGLEPNTIYRLFINISVMLRSVTSSPTATVRFGADVTVGGGGSINTQTLTHLSTTYSLESYGYYITTQSNASGTIQVTPKFLATTGTAGITVCSTSVIASIRD